MTKEMHSTLIDAKFIRREGKMSLVIDARPFHELLTRIGAPKGRQGDRFVNRPQSAEQYIDARNNSIMTFALLHCPGDPITINLLDYYRDTPPTFEQIKKLGQSVETVAQLILDHYRPVEVSVKVFDKTGATEPYQVPQMVAADDTY